MKSLNKILEVLLDTLKQTKDLAAKEIPLVVQELLKWNMIESVMYGSLLLLLSLGIIGIVIYFVEVSITEYTRDNRFYYLFLALVGFPVCTGVSFIMDAIKIKVAPRVAILDIAKEKLERD